MRMQGRRLVLAGIVKANALGLLIIMFALYNFKELDYSRLTLVSFCFINIVLEWGVRMFIFYSSERHAKERNEPETGAAGWIQPCR